jgi:hypothetical protein
MRWCHVALVLSSAIGLSGRVWAYGLQTHAALSHHAVLASNLYSYLPSELGLPADGQLALAMISRPRVNNGSPDGWVQEGSVREDDNPKELTGLYPRVINHFYNPLTGDGLSIPAVGLLFPLVGLQWWSSPTWGLEDEPWQSGIQMNSLYWARLYFYWGLTSATPVEREQNLALMFRSVGDLIHLVQDMAQPQHTRDDEHFLRADYEVYTDQEGVRSFLPFDGYGPVYPGPEGQSVPFRFDEPHKFWHTTEANVQDRNGLADYTNRGFVSEGTNFVTNPFPTIDVVVARADFPDPSGSTATLWQPAIDLLDACTWTDPTYQPHGLLAFVQTPVHDAFRPGTDAYNTMTSTESVFDPDLDLHSQPKTFTLNCYNFEAAQQLLIPRAVGYSAGLINYFFRGKIDFACDNPGGGAAPCVIKNLGDEDLKNGTFALYAEDPAGNRALVTSWSPGTVPAHGSVRVAGFTAPNNAARYVLVFRGKMGLEEDAVVGKVIPNSFLLMTITATYQYHPSDLPDHPSDLPADTSWQQLGRGPLNHTLYEWQRRGSAEGAAVNERLLFASFGVNRNTDDEPMHRLWKSTDGGRTFVEISATLSPDRPLNAVTFLGGTELLAAFNAGVNHLPLVGGFAYSNDLGATWEWEPRASFIPSQIEPGVLSVGGGVVIAQGMSTGDGSHLIRSTDKGRTWSEAKPFIDGSQWTCPDFVGDEFAAPQCAAEYQNWQAAYYHDTHDYIWKEFCDSSVPDPCNCVSTGGGPNGLQRVLSVFYDRIPDSTSCSCDGSCCAGYFLHPDLAVLSSLRDAFSTCWFRVECTRTGLTIEPTCNGKWETYAMAWNNVDGEGSVILAGGASDRIDSQGNFDMGQLGIWKSTDGGEHWRLVKDTTVICNPDDMYLPIREPAPVISVAIAPSGEALAVTELARDYSTGDGYRSPKKLYRSTDAGETWNEIANPEGSGAIGVMYLGGAPAVP